MNELWNKLLTNDVLARGWNLARLDTRNDFAEDLYSTSWFGIDLKPQLTEIINQLKLGTFQPQPLRWMEVPKGPLGFRPGTVIPIRDRVVVSAIVFLIAEILDDRLPNSVFSWRIKHPLPKKDGIFKNSDITDVPFLKNKTIKIAIDPFESWYEMWPEFYIESIKTFEQEGYRFLAISDIAAYFENIQLPILRDMLVTALPEEIKIVNLLFSFLESWTLRAVDGKPHLRGIPQGNLVSSFLGNYFLSPLDRSFEDFARDNDVKYFRYVDDVRIFTKRVEDARLAIFHMDRQIRKLHLNVQTAKTKILDESKGEISRELIDSRVDDLSGAIKEIEALIRDGRLTSSMTGKYLKLFDRISKKPGPNKQKIKGNRGPLTGMTMRAFRRWVSGHLILRSSGFIGRLMYEFRCNPDPRVTKKLIATTRMFPRKPLVLSQIMEFIESDENIYPHQEAECIRAVRYLSRVTPKIVEHCKQRIQNIETNQYLRVQCAYLLSRVAHKSSYLSSLKEVFENEEDGVVQAAIATVLVQIEKNNEKLIEYLVMHPSSRVQETGKLFRAIQVSLKEAKERIRHAFQPEVPWRICDNMSYVYVMAYSPVTEVRQAIMNSLASNRGRIQILDIRDSLDRTYLKLKATTTIELDDSSSQLKLF